MGICEPEIRSETGGCERHGNQSKLEVYTDPRRVGAAEFHMVLVKKKKCLWNKNLSVSRGSCGHLQPAPDSLTNSYLRGISAGRHLSEAPEAAWAVFSLIYF